jgi:hypothetical protein
MKRVVFLMILALVFCLGASAVYSQNWAPGPPPVSAMPQAGIPMPVMGPQGPIQAFDPSCCPPPPCPPPGCAPVDPCMPMPCGPSRRASLGAMVGWQVSDDIGGIKFSTQGSPSFNMTGQKVNFNLEGVWLGVSGRMELGDCVSGRLEWRHFFPSTTHVETITPLAIGPRGVRRFTTSRYQWDVVDASVGINVACGLSAIGGFRWDYFSVYMSHPPQVQMLSSTADRGDITINFYEPYIGAEFALQGCDSGIMFRMIGSPWVPSSLKYGMTFGYGGTEQELPWIHDRMNVNSKWASFVEASVYYGKKVSDSITLGAFALVNNVTSHSEGSLSSYRGIPEFDLSEKFDVDLNRRAYAIGGNLAVAVPSPL